MAVRFPEHKGFDYCLNPLHIIQDGNDVVVPCGHCDGCKVHAANVWAMRLSQEIDSCPDSIFLTLTYFNKYLPTLRVQDEINHVKVWSSNHRNNWRFASSRSSLRNDDITLIGNYDPVEVTNFDDCDVIPYASKLDIQLWLKLVRKELDNLDLKQNGQKYFRYFIISEYGETKFRPHYHCIIFPRNRQIAEVLLNGALYSSWQMCDKDRFEEFCTYCSSGTSNYLTTYVNSISRIPKVYKNNEIRPFRLCSKSPSIGYGSYNRENIIEGIVEGSFEYVRTIKRADDKYLLRYSKDYLSGTFPKCAEYSKKSFDELLFTYGSIYRFNRIEKSESTEFYYTGLPTDLRPSDYNASRKCCQVCDSLGCTPFHYLYLLDMAWYLNDMYALKLFYSLQEQKGNTLDVMRMYNNISDYLASGLNQLQIYAFDLFCDGFNVDPLDVKNILPEDLFGSSRPDSDYINELADILSNMVKMPKLNESLGISPVCLY